jgi:hypothetical protein
MSCKVIWKIGLWIATAAVLAVPAVQASGSTASVAAALRAQYARFNRAAARGDERAAMSLLTRGYTETEIGGHRMNWNQVRADQKRAFEKLKLFHNLHINTWIDSLKVNGSTATVLAATTITGTLIDRRGLPHEFVETSRARDFWVLTAGQWKQKSSVALAETSTVDGRTQ